MNIALLFFGIASIANVSGAEKVFVEMANRFSERGANVYAVWNDEPGVVPYYSFSQSANPINLGLGKIRVPLRYKVIREIAKGLHLNITNRVDQYKTEKLCREIKKQIDFKTIDVIICYEFNSVMVANQIADNKIPVIAMCHNSIQSQIVPLTPLQRCEASKVTLYQVLMPSFVSEAKKLLNTEVIYIPNIVRQIPDNRIANLSADKDIHKVVSVCRIDPYQKRPLLAIKAFLVNANKFPNWRFELYGPISDKNYKKEIDDYIQIHDTYNQVKYMGITNRMESVLNHADIFALPSAYEGFGLALTEANAMGLPAIGFSYAPSVNELIQNGKTGFLAVDENDFAKKMKILMGNRTLRIEMGKAARNAMRQYAPNIVWGQWESLITQIVGKEMNE